mmetsp:Transcript_88569/g.236727  ORF Transcript_88569/g.236727 Transcript_88569/m.236727 type:complete len:224 (+) Transcript_88569:544-1215(+)
MVANRERVMGRPQAVRLLAELVNRKQIRHSHRPILGYQVLRLVLGDRGRAELLGRRRGKNIVQPGDRALTAELVYSGNAGRPSILTAPNPSRAPQPPSLRAASVGQQLLQRADGPHRTLGGDQLPSWEVPARLGLLHPQVLTDRLIKLKHSVNLAPAWAGLDGIHDLPLIPSLRITSPSLVLLGPENLLPPAHTGDLRGAHGRRALDGGHLGRRHLRGLQPRR